MSCVGIYTLLTDTWIWKLGLWPRNSFSGNICFEFSVLVLCSLVGPVHYFNSFVPIPQQAGQAVVLGRLSLSMLNLPDQSSLVVPFAHMVNLFMITFYSVTTGETIINCTCRFVRRRRHFYFISNFLRSLIIMNSLWPCGLMYVLERWISLHTFFHMYRPALTTTWLVSSCFSVPNSTCSIPQVFSVPSRVAAAFFFCLKLWTHGVEGAQPTGPFWVCPLYTPVPAFHGPRFPNFLNWPPRRPAGWGTWPQWSQLADSSAE